MFGFPFLFQKQTKKKLIACRSEKNYSSEVASVGAGTHEKHMSAPAPTSSQQWRFLNEAHTMAAS